MWEVVRANTDGGPWSAELSSTRRVTVDTFQGKAMVNVREMYTDASTGELKPGRKGLSMIMDQFQNMLEGEAAINNAIQKGGVEGFVVDLSETRKVSVSKFKGNLTVDLREYYKKGDKLLPGQKGICLPLDQWQTLASQFPAILRAMEDLGARRAPPAPSAAAESAPKSEVDASLGKKGVVMLSNNRRAEARLFQGKRMFDLREMYEDKSTGELKPGKKGVCLDEAQFLALRDNASEIHKAVEQNDTKYVLKLAGSMRRVSVELFKDTTMVSIREFFLKDGEERPGMKGLNLTKPQWTILYDNMIAINAAWTELK